VNPPFSQVLAREDNSGYQYSYEPLELPLDGDGFVSSFAPDDADGICAFFGTYGLVVVEGVLGDAECERSRSELWDFIERRIPGLSRELPQTWERWPSLSGLGILGNTFNVSPQLCANRQSPACHRAFSALFGTERLLVNVGRASVMRPTVGVPWPDAAGGTVLVEKREWRSKPGREWLHWDMNPFTGASSTFSWRLRDMHANRGYERLSVQGILALGDCGADDGGFYCVPGSHKVVRGWANANGATVADKSVQSPESSCQIYLPGGDPMKDNAQRAPIREGSLLVWDSKLAHCNFPNASANLRMVQYIQMIRAEDPVVGPLFTDENLLPPTAELELSQLGRRLYGFEPWPRPL
jgi:hypothetical protein